MKRLIAIAAVAASLFAAPAIAADDMPDGDGDHRSNSAEASKP